MESTQTVTQVEEEKADIVTFTVKPRKQGGIRWTEDTIDNEHMNKKKSKSKQEAGSWV